MKKIALIFPKDSESIFNTNMKTTFGGATVQMYLIGKELAGCSDLEVYSIINNYRNISFNHIDKFKFIKTFDISDNIIKKFSIFFYRIIKLKPNVLIQRGLSPFSPLLALYCRILKIKFIFMFAHDREIQGIYQRKESKCLLFKLLLKKSAFLICQTGYQYKLLLEKYLFKARIIKSGYEISIKRSKKRNAKSVLWVSRVEEWKRPELFIKLAMLNPNKKFIMIAPLSQGYESFYERIKAMTLNINNLLFTEFVHFHKIDNYFKNARVFINTSVKEGFPNTFIQACKNATPVLSLNVNPDNFLGKYKCGYFCNDDFNKANKRLKALFDDNALFEKLSINAFNYASKYHDIKNNVKQLIELF